MKKRILLIFALSALFILIGCGDARVIKSAQLYIDVEKETLSYESKDFTANLVLDQAYELKLTLNENVSFANDFELYINEMKIGKDAYTKDGLTINYTFISIDEVNPNILVEVNTIFNLNGGVLTKADFTDLEPDNKLTITTLNDQTGTTFSVITSANYTLRYSHKIFIKYSEAYQAYEVVYVDPASNSIANLNVLSYDFILALNQNFSDVETRNIIESYTNKEKDLKFVLFDKNILNYKTGDMEVSFYTLDMIGETFEKTLLEPTNLPIPVRNEYRFIGWFNGDKEVISYPSYQRKDQISNLVYEAKWEAYSMTELENHLNTIISDETYLNLNLPLTYSGFNLEWSSNKPDVITNEGIYIRPYHLENVVLTLHITSQDIDQTKTFNIIAKGYKSLEKPIASSYIYRDYEAVDDAFFETLDVINTAFILANDEGDLYGSHYLEQVSTHIIPKAKKNGNWVIMSVGPSTSWSSIASSSLRINHFADQIVQFINDYGFDGVDIDWETPSTAEATRYTSLMRIVYEKVKANNSHHLVTTAIAGGRWQPPKYDLLNSSQYIDYINVMTYGLTSGSGQYQNPLYYSDVYHNTTLKVGKVLITTSIDESVKMFRDTYQVSYDKLIIGLAFYGMKQTKIGSTWTAAGSVYYHEIYNSLLKNPNYTEYYDRNAGVPYMIKNDGSEFISYDNPKSILEKSNYIIDNNLAGLMFWEYGTDTSGVLLQAMRTGLQK